MPKEAYSEVRGAGAFDGGGGGEPPHGRLMARDGQCGVSLAEGGRWSEALLDVWGGNVPDNMAYRGLEKVKQVLGLLFGAVRLGAASFGIDGGRVIGTVMVFKGYQELQPCDAWGGTFGRYDAEAVEEPGHRYGLDN